MGASKRGLNECIEYIITWLCYGDRELAKRVAYTKDEKALEDHDVIIIPNGDFGNRIVLPEMDKVQVEQPAKGKAIIRTDIVYNTFFFISRAEETFNTNRDDHERFLAHYSILGEKNRLQIPMLDEHARLLLKLLNAPMPESGFGHIYLTHDIDSISQYRHLRGFLGGLKRGEKAQAWAAVRDIYKDPLYTFPWLMEQDAKVPNAEQIYFVKQTYGSDMDYPQYPLWGRDYKRLRQQILDRGGVLGVHSSYYGDLPSKPISTLHRSHYLRGSVSFFTRLVKAGYTDDFTMGFADQAGFRLQTSRAVRWINPYTYKLSTLTLHPMLVMDNTLNQENYMDLTEDEAYFLCEHLIAKVKMHHGDLCLLWHNSNINDETYHRTLYPKILELLKGEK